MSVIEGPAPLALTIKQPVYDCANGHLDTSIITFEIPLGVTPVRCCAACWRDWMIAKGWAEVTERKEAP